MIRRLIEPSPFSFVTRASLLTVPEPKRSWASDLDRRSLIEVSPELLAAPSGSACTEE